MRPELPASLLAALSERLEALTGLHFPQQRWGDLERGIAVAAPALGLADAESCARRLLGAPLTQRQVGILASHLTVGETYFFRGRPSFEALERCVLPDLLRAREGVGRRLRIWSAGCCTGEEAYSIAMLLDRLIPDIEEWHITILATDINPEFLRGAADALYRDWSLRATPDRDRERYFKRRGNGRFEILPRIRKGVTFAYLNLADDSYPSLASNTCAMDLIFCCNVLLYFNPARVRRVAENFHRSLVTGGWLIVSPVEATNSLFPRFEAVAFPGAMFYRKVADRVTQPGLAEPPGVLSEPLPTIPSAWEELLDITLEPAREGSVAARPPSREETAAWCRAARDCANQGRLAEAAHWCEQALSVDQLDPATHYLLATIRQEQGRIEAAAEALRSVLYLDPEFALAHFDLGNLRLAQGRRREAERHFANALAALRGRPQDEILPRSEGLTAGRLAEIIASVLARGRPASP